jgi:DNA gyrase subunit A
MIAIQTSERNGKVVSAILVSPSDDIMLITTGGVLVRTRVDEIREMGRATQGVTLISVDDGSRLSGVRRVVERDVEVLGDVSDVSDVDDVNDVNDVNGVNDDSVVDGDEASTDDAES